MGARKKALNFSAVHKADIPRGRRGKHNGVVTRMLEDLARLGPGQAIRIPLAELAEDKAKVRSALNRATRLQRRHVGTASDDEYLYVWNEEKP